MLDKVRPVDMFPQTPHIECVARSPRPGRREEPRDRLAGAAERRHVAEGVRARILADRRTLGGLGRLDGLARRVDRHPLPVRIEPHRHLVGGGSPASWRPAGSRLGIQTSLGAARTPGHERTPGFRCVGHERVGACQDAPSPP